jgi:hypothetical protein
MVWPYFSKRLVMSDVMDAALSAMEGVVSQADARAERNRIMTKIALDMQSVMENMYFRWLDEKEYEDFNEYKAVAQKKLAEVAPEAEFVTLRKCPFDLVFKMPNFPWKVALTINGRSYGWKSA